MVRHTRLYEFPGGFLELWDYGDADDEEPGTRLELFVTDVGPEEDHGMEAS
ncbi:hypothetical protein BJY24_004355 [Nocardia transvalensis]|uniref:Uncharacterized protein n=1 Tax=Nocardia transvalensis TaxID=37333 RepID=A0A7W9PGZ6_9NOCA|nr:hypothetical protein [Nocardia transvalensis]MBB5915443.1 hypothetical protein [Nocardia transvalensis]